MIKDRVPSALVCFAGSIVASAALGCRSSAPEPPDFGVETAALVPADYVGFWRLDETTGTTAIDAYTTAPHNGTLYNGSTAGANGPAWGAAKLGNGLTFDGVDDSVRIADFSYGPAFSIALWFKITDNTGASGDANVLYQHGTQWTANNVAVLVPKSGDAGAGEIWTYVNDSNDVGVAGYGIGGNYADASWHYYVLTVGACPTCPDNAKIYVDGQQRLALARGGDAINPATQIFLGRRTDSTEPLKGLLDEVRLYNRAITSQEATDLFLLTVPDDYVGYWKFDETTGTSATDSYATVPHAGTLYNGATANANGPTWTAGGMVGTPRSLTFDGSNDNVRIADFSYGPAFSFTLWFKIINNTGAASDWHTLFTHGTLFSTNSIGVIVPKSGDAGNGEIWAYVSDTNDATSGIGIAKPPGGTWADGAWHHVAVTVGTCPTCPTNTNIYVDGALKASAQRGGDSINPATTFFLGTRADLSDPLNGALDDVRLYNRTLSAQDVANIYAFRGSVCGNSVVEAGEDCDTTTDTCCDLVTCRFLTAGTSCSDTSATDCKVAQCTGSSAVCNQTAANVTNGNGCGDGVCDQCSSGVCVATGSGVQGPGCTAGALECSNADTCDGAGGCLANNVTDGTTCSSGTCAGGVCQASPAPPTDTLGSWHLDDTGGGTAADAAATPHAGTLYDGTTSNRNGPIWSGVGKVGRSLSFDGSNDSVRIPDFAYGPSFSVALWFKVRNNTGLTGDWNTLFAHGTMWAANNVTVVVPKSGDAGNGEIWTYVVDSNDTTTGVGVPKPGGGSWADGAWHHYVLTVGTDPLSATNAKVYVDGVQKLAFQRGGDAIDPATSLYLGLATDSTDALNGALDEVRVYGRALTATEVTSLYSEATPAEIVQGAPAVAMTTWAPYTEDTNEKLLNPERGWNNHIQHTYLSTMDQLRTINDGYFDDSPGTTAVMLIQTISPTSDTVSPTILTQLQTAFDRARTDGIKVMPRIQYYDSDATSGNEPSATRMIAHINQVMAVITANADVVAAVQLGSVGRWGEWNHSPLLGWNGSTEADSNASSQSVVNAYLDALPTERSLQFRTPMKKDAHFGGSNAGQITDAKGFDESKVARIGHYNDCFLRNDTDSGTFALPVTTWKNYVGQDTRFTPMGGETCEAPGRARCSTALAELAWMHWSWVHNAYQIDVVGPNGLWANGTPPCRSDIARRLGYRFVLVRARFSAAVKPSEILELEVDLRNDGFASPYNLRPLYAVLTGGGQTYLALLNTGATDPRRWEAGARTLRKRLKMPNVAAGTYTLALWMPDSFQRIRTDARYAIRFANTGTWSDTTGYNTLTTALSVSTSAASNTTGPVDATFVLQ